MEWGHYTQGMNYARPCDERKLLEMIQKSLDNLKKAEKQLETYKNIPSLRGRYLTRVNVLKKIYIELLFEAKKRKISLDREQLLKRILFTMI